MEQKEKFCRISSSHLGSTGTSTGHLWTRRTRCCIASAFRKICISQEYGTTCVKKGKKLQCVGLLEKKRKYVLTSVPVFQQLGTQILQTLSVIFKKPVWRICRQLLGHLSVATEDQEGFDLLSGKDIVSAHKTFPLSTQGLLTWAWTALPLLPCQTLFPGGFPTSIQALCPVSPLEAELRFSSPRDALEVWRKPGQTLFLQILPSSRAAAAPWSTWGSPCPLQDGRKDNTGPHVVWCKNRHISWEFLLGSFQEYEKAKGYNPTAKQT